MIRDESISVLRAIKKHGPITLRALDGMNVHPSQSGCNASLYALRHEQEMIEIWDFIGGLATYIITDKGNAFLAALDRPKSPKGEIAKPREPEPFKPLKVKPWQPARSGAEAHQHCPSLRNGREKPWERPFIVSGHVEPVGVHGVRP